MVSAWLAVGILGTLAGVEAARAQDAERGRHVFRKCAVCHVVSPGSTSRLAPPLDDVVNRPAASVPGFEYSEIMQTAGRSGLRWSKEALFHFLDRPEAFMPGTYMAFAGLEPQERHDVIAYLETLTPQRRKSETAPASRTGAGDSPEQHTSSAD